MISKEEVKHVAKLARLGLSEKEIEKMQKELSVILDYINLLRELDISDIKPTSHSILLENISREDIIKEEDSQTVLKLLEAPPSKEKGHIKVKGILG
ncbi:Asp-tRNA(Asn)/Glu-tRNA(Gln) amidotransferase subunit GatC [Patescibacteria group bacterium]|nr:Asp-tRNA(Asn)/Glu-tRNA(Gln) amidotransferase subunit GatC [Patescibacteria group bacterium]